MASLTSRPAVHTARGSSVAYKPFSSGCIRSAVACHATPQHVVETQQNGPHIEMSRRQLLSAVVGTSVVLQSGCLEAKADDFQTTDSGLKYFDVK